MKKFHKIVLTILIIAILLFFISFLLGFKTADIKELFTKEHNYEKAEPYITSNDITTLKINIDGDGVIIKSHDRNTIEINYYLKNHQTVTINEENNILELNYTITKEFRLLFVIGPYNYKSSDVEIFVPKDSNLNIIIDSKVGNVSLSNLELSNLTVELNTGNINLKNINAPSLDLTNKTGNIVLYDVISNETNIVNNVGDISLNNINTNNIIVNTNTGNILVNGITAKNIDIENNVGNINTKNLMGNSIDLYTKTGNITIKENNPYTLDLRINNVGNLYVNKQKQANYYYLNNGENTLKAAVSTGNLTYN